MSLEIRGSAPEDRRLGATVATAVGELLLAQGVQPSHAATTGTQGGEYGAAVIFAALREMGCWPPEGLDAGVFERTVSVVVQLSK